ncbi:putative Dihydrolipoyl dehydrogenase, E3 component of pyruvate and 2-oxoglutarate dehydrogenase complexes [Nitrospira tepida]|uniref:Dihydrolipoyl dehydrogenase, E3 component of pyruvate and 2-oxoglutarate dehydrogenase complexes n=1 Tax=Nitrospira tepida TaxID=2973512 RepID=A0AA86N3H5_9BACT|nr:FAD-dependent oxidoreductase [Nitrospira tepida]CAI4034163.1 putative Dihydrolipoyl dehydrogenase, E3 component of pyruvate and 2-oxoglutarate dehydrogenase complexes [Nitrospira tepida]
MTHDVIVIGGGSAGYAAARTARDAGADVGIVDQGPLGGLCILRGCMPSKAILRSAEIAALMKRAKEFGLEPVPVRADLSAIVDRKNRLVQEFAEDRIKALKDPRFTLYQARARFTSPHEILVGETVLTARSFIVATGSIPCDVPIPGLKEAGYETSDSILDLREQPASLVVLGGGAVATEFGQFFARIGSCVMILQRGDHLLSDFDDEVGQTVETAFRQEGIEVHLDCQVRRVTCQGGEKVVEFEQAGRVRSVAAELILQALGRKANIAGLNLEVAGVAVRDGRMMLNEEMRTSQPHIFAVGDVNDLNPIVHIAIQQGEIAGYNATHPTAVPKRIDNRLDSDVIFTDPQVAAVGWSEKVCRRRGVPYLAASYPFADHGKALCSGQTQGFVKLLCHPRTGQLLGAQVVGPEAGELVHELAAVMYYRGTVQDLLRIPHYHPTLAEIVTYPAEELVARLQAEDHVGSRAQQ